MAVEILRGPDHIAMILDMDLKYSASAVLLIGGSTIFGRTLNGCWGSGCDWYSGPLKARRRRTGRTGGGGISEPLQSSEQDQFECQEDEHETTKDPERIGAIDPGHASDVDTEEAGQ